MISLDHVQIAAPAGCEAAARRFYGELLGLRELDKPEPLRARGGAWFELGDGRGLHVGVEQQFAPARKAHPAFAVAGEGALDELAERLAAAGSPVVWDEALPGSVGSTPKIRGGTGWSCSRRRRAERAGGARRLLGGARGPWPSPPPPHVRLVAAPSGPGCALRPLGPES